MGSAGQSIAGWLTYAEQTIYVLTAALLVVTAALLLFTIARTLVSSLRTGPIRDEALKALDSLLIVLMIVELLHTIRLFIVEHALVPEPFLIIALIAGVRRMLILTTEASQFIQTKPDQFRMAMIEMALLLVSFIVIAGAILLLRQTAA